MSEIKTNQYRSDIPRIDPDEKALWIDGMLNEFAEMQGQNALKTPKGTFDQAEAVDEEE